MDFSYNDYVQYFCNGGFLLPKLEAELPLYRYRGNIEYIVDEIENDHIYMAPLDELNDPFDSSCAITFEDLCQSTYPIMYFHLSSYFLDGKPWYAELDRYIRNLPDNQVTLLEYSEIASSFLKGLKVNIKPLTICQAYYQKCLRKPTQKRRLGKVASFSETWESIPMWSYYANSHKGVCMKYDFSALDTENIVHKNICSALQKVWYSEQRFLDSNGAFTPFVKSLQWAHEQEWRLFREDEEKYLSIPCLTEIYLGIDFDCDHLSEITQAVRKNGRDIKVFLVHPKPNLYGFEQIPLKF